MATVEDFVTRLSQALPPQLGPLRAQLHANFRAIVQSQLARLDLVPREEFEAAREMLVHSRRRVDELQRRVEALEAVGKPDSRA